MTQHRYFLFAALATILVAAVRVPLAAQSAGERRLCVAGTVVDNTTHEPLAGVTVQVLQSKIGTVTDAAGRYRLFDLQPGSYRIRFSSVGYEAVVKTDVAVNAVRPATLDVAMIPQPSLQGEVVVRPEYFQRDLDAAASRQTLGGEEIRRLPGGFEDVVRGVSTLPGVAQAQNGRNDLLVRGGAPSENLFLIDNIEVPNINHFGTQGSGGGPLSFVNLDFVQSVTFSSGGFGAQYGDRISSVLTIDLRDGRDDRFGGKATISASQFGLNVEGSVTGSGSYLASVRRSYLDFIFRAAGLSFVPEYWDLLGKVSYRLGRNDRLSVLAIGAIDRVKQFNDNADARFDNSRILDNSQNQLVAGVTWNHLFSGGYLNATLGRTLVTYRFRQSDSLLMPVFTDSSTEDEINLRLDAQLDLAEATELSVGAGARTIGFDAALFLARPAAPLDVSLADRFLKGEAYVQLAHGFPWGMRAVVGGRIDYFSGISNRTAASLRGSLSQSVDERSTVTASAGRYYQSPSYIWLVANDDNRKLRDIRTDVFVLGVDRVLAEDVRVSLEGYYKAYGDYPAAVSRPFLLLANTGAGFGGADEGFASFGIDPLTSGGTGRAYGVELLLQKKLSAVRCYGLVSLSLGRSLFTALDGVERPGNYDQQLIFNVSGGYQPDDRWEVGFKFRLATGRPYTPVASTGDPAFGYLVTSQYNALRLASSHALDVRVDRRWPFDSWSLITYVDVQNVYNRKNPLAPRWNARLNGPDTENNQIGILPSIGISAEF
ncbi:MAG TPA: TonB-dependent receptor [Candidatus Kapabacteria bacterium]|nr:TonB-dependent receptor [Candidatus Kapabacteria bacterium]